MNIGVLIAASIALAVVSAIVCLRFVARATRHEQGGGQARWHLFAFAFGTLAATFLVASLLLGSGWLYSLLQGASFTRDAVGPGGPFDADAFVGLLGVVFGVPLAISGAIYAIYLAQVSLAVSRAQFELTRRQLIQEHPFHESFTRIGVAKWRMERYLAAIKDSLAKTPVDIRFAEELMPTLKLILDELGKEEIRIALVDFAIGSENPESSAQEFENLLQRSKEKLEGATRSLKEPDFLRRLHALVASLESLDQSIPDRRALDQRLLPPTKA